MTGSDFELSSKRRVEVDLVSRGWKVENIQAEKTAWAKAMQQEKASGIRRTEGRSG